MSVGKVAMFGGPAAAISYVVTGPELDTLSSSARAVAALLAQVPGAADVDTSLATGKPELHVRIDRERAADLGVDVADISATLALVVAGAPVSSYVEKGETYDVFLRAAAAQRKEALGAAAAVDRHRVGRRAGQRRRGRGVRRWVPRRARSVGSARGKPAPPVGRGCAHDNGANLGAGP